MADFDLAVALQQPAFAMLPEHWKPRMREIVLARPFDFRMGDVMWAQHGVIRAAPEGVEAWERLHGNPYDDEDDDRGNQYDDEDNDMGGDSGDEGGDDEDVADDESKGSFMSDDSSPFYDEGTVQELMRGTVEDGAVMSGAIEHGANDDVAADELDETGDLEKEVSEMLGPDATDCKDADDFACTLFGGDGGDVSKVDEDKVKAVDDFAISLLGGDVDNDKDSFVTDEECTAMGQGVDDGAQGQKIDDQQFDKCQESDDVHAPKIDDEQPARDQRIDDIAQDQMIDGVAKDQEIDGVEVTIFDVVNGVTQIPPTIIPPTPRWQDIPPTPPSDTIPPTPPSDPTAVGEAVDEVHGMGEDVIEDKRGMGEGENKDTHGMNVDKGDTEFVKVKRKRGEVELDAAGWPIGIDKDTRGETCRVVSAPSMRHRWRHRRVFDDVIDASSMRHR